MALQGDKSVRGNELTPGLDGYDQRSGLVRCDWEGSVASSINTFRSMSLGQGSKGAKKAVTQPPGILQE